MPKKLRCAIYTRKSTEEGLDKAFNSLDAQREACSAFIASQKHEGWQELPAFYDDGGFSGGSMDRPSLVQLLEDIQSGDIDVVVVYKVDRLTRALADFARIVAIFDAAGVSFVSVTQQFNTTNSMGRLTLNVLLSFAQFEREVTAERIRDKIVASKAKGMWMGGIPPIGYQPQNRVLVPVPDEAKMVRRIFERYLEQRSVRKLQAELKWAGRVTPVRTTQKGATSGGCTFSRGKLYHLLSNPIYIGRIRHRDKIYDGQHEAIIDQDIWDKAQTMLADNRRNHANRSKARSPSPLAGKLFDPAGNKMRPVHTTKSGRRYRYYVSPELIEGSVETGANGWRIPAEELESILSKAIVEHLHKPKNRQSFIGDVGDPKGMELLINAIDELLKAVQFKGSRHCTMMLKKIVQCVYFTKDQLTAQIDIGRAFHRAENLNDIDLPTLQFSAPIKLARRGGELKLILKGAAGDATNTDPNLIKTLLDARRRYRSYTGEVETTLSQIATNDDTDTADVSRSLQLAFLAPDLVAGILDGRQTPE
ncbi:MAG: recombinase family protein, partial [Boseongicola sp.]|nr:recombinase family protein [Boseongicola sp.]